MPAYLSNVDGDSGVRARCVAASRYEGQAIHTLEIRSPMFLDAEFEKHRAISSNSSSNRAIPSHKMIQMVKDDPFIPETWRKNEPGMQGYEEVDDPEWCKEKWLFARDEVIFRAEQLSALVEGKNIHNGKVIYDGNKVHKQTVNRLLAPWLWQTKVVTGTEWENFFKLRLAKDAQPEMQHLAAAMKTAMEKTTPVELERMEWHLPYITQKERDTLDQNDLYAASVARCARTSYVTHEQKETTIEEDRDLYKRLFTSGHLTPFEHQATPIIVNDHWTKIPGVTHMDRRGRLWSGNFKWWVQYRQLLQEWN